MTGWTADDVAESSQVPTRLRRLCLEKTEGKTSGSDWVPHSGQGSSQEMLSVTGTHGCFDFSLQRAWILAGLLSLKAINSLIKDAQSSMGLSSSPKHAFPECPGLGWGCPDCFYWTELKTPICKMMQLCFVLSVWIPRVSVIKIKKKKCRLWQLI